MIKIGLEYHSILKNIFGEIKNYQQSNQIQVCCPRCQQRDGLDISDGKFNLEINTEKRYLDVGNAMNLDLVVH